MTDTVTGTERPASPPSPEGDDLEVGLEVDVRGEDQRFDDTFPDSLRQIIARHKDLLDEARNTFVAIEEQLSSPDGNEPEANTPLRDALYLMNRRFRRRIDHDPILKPRMIFFESLARFVAEKQVEGQDIGLAEVFGKFAKRKSVAKEETENYEDLLPIFKTIAQATRGIIPDLRKAAEDDPSIGAALLEALVSDQEEYSPAGLIKIILSQEWRDRGQSSLLAELINPEFTGQFLDTSPESYLETSLQEGEPQSRPARWINFMFEFSKLKADSDRGDFIAQLVAMRDLWPPELESDFHSYVKSRHDDFRNSINETIKQFVIFDSRTPRNMREIEDLWARTITVSASLEAVQEELGASKSEVMMARAARKLERKRGQRQRRKAGPAGKPEFNRSGKIDDSADNTAETELKKRKPVAIELLEGDRYRTVGPEVLEEMIQGVLRKGDEKFADDLKNLITELGKQPINTGAMKINNIKRPITVDGEEKGMRVWRVNPRHWKGLSIGSAAKELRIVYAFSENNLYILRIFDNHEEYERFADNLK